MVKQLKKMSSKPNPFENKGIAKAIRELYESGITDYNQIWKKLKEKGITASRSYVWQKVKKLKAKPFSYKPAAIETAKPTGKPPEIKIEFAPVKVPEEIKEAEAVTAQPPTVAEAAAAEGLISPEEMEGMLETLNSLSTNPRYQMHKKSLPALAKAWVRVINKRLTDVSDPNFDIYWAAAITFMAALPPLMNYIGDRRKVTEKSKSTSETVPLKARAQESQAAALFGAPEPSLQPEGAK